MIIGREYIFIVLILSMTQVVPVWHIAVKIVTILLALKGMMKTIWLVRLHWVQRNRPKKQGGEAQAGSGGIK